MRLHIQTEAQTLHDGVQSCHCSQVLDYMSELFMPVTQITEQHLCSASHRLMPFFVTVSL